MRTRELGREEPRGVQQEQV